MFKQQVALVCLQLLSMALSKNSALQKPLTEKLKPIRSKATALFEHSVSPHCSLQRLTSFHAGSTAGRRSFPPTCQLERQLSVPTCTAALFTVQHAGTAAGYPTGSMQHLQQLCVPGPPPASCTSSPCSPALSFCFTARDPFSSQLISST